MGAERAPALRAVLFDLDGTVLDTAPDMAGALNRLRSENRLEPLPFERIRPCVSHGAARLVKLGFPDAPPAEFGALQRRFLELYSGAASVQTRLFEGMDCVIESISARGLRCGIVTNKPGWLTDPLLAQLDLTPLFACVVSGDTVRLPSRTRCRCCMPRVWPASRLRNVCMSATPSATSRRRTRPECRDWWRRMATCIPARIGGPGAATAPSAVPRTARLARVQRAAVNGGGRSLDFHGGPACLGLLLGALSALLLRAKREQTLRVELEVQRARIKSEEIIRAERERALDDARLQLQRAFGDVARASLNSNSEVFLQLAKERWTRQQSDAAAALKERETAIESMVQPIREALSRTEAQIQSIERERVEAFASLRSQMEVLGSGQSLLSRETRNLVSALRRPQVRGQWGEITLKRLVELSGMSAHVDFTEQYHQATESGPIRPDMIVHMPDSATSWSTSRHRSMRILRPSRRERR